MRVCESANLLLRVPLRILLHIIPVFVMLSPPFPRLSWFDFGLIRSFFPFVCRPVDFGCNWYCNSKRMYVMYLVYTSAYFTYFSCLRLYEVLQRWWILVRILFYFLGGILPLQSYWSLSCDHGLRCSDELM